MAERRGRGFAGMDAAKQRAIASKGGKAAHQKGTAHEFNQEEARVAGRKGGQAAHQKGTAHEFTTEEARAAGRKGGQASHARRQMQPMQLEMLKSLGAGPRLESERLPSQPSPSMNEVIPALAPMPNGLMASTLTP